MMRTVVLFTLLLYLFGDTVITLWRHGWPFGAAQWVLLVLAIAYIPLGYILGKRLVTQYKKSRQPQEPEEEKNDTE